MEQNTFWANTKKRLKKKSYQQQRIKTAASKVEATQIAATAAVMTAVFFILKYAIVSLVINLSGSPLIFFDEEYRSAATNGYVAKFFVILISALILIHMAITDYVSKRYKNWLPKVKDIHKVKFIKIIILISVLFSVFYIVFPLLLKIFPQATLVVFLIVALIFAFHCMLYYKHLMTRLAFFNVTFIVSGFIMIIIIIVATLDSEKPKRQEFTMHYYDETDSLQRIIISNDNFSQTANLIWFRNEDNNTIYIPKGRVLMYEKR